MTGCEEGLSCYTVAPNGSIKRSCPTHADLLGDITDGTIIDIVAKVNTHADPSPCPLTACLRRLVVWCAAGEGGFGDVGRQDALQVDTAAGGCPEGEHDRRNRGETS